MTCLNRRQFLQSATVGAAALNAFPYHLFAGTTRKTVSDRVKLGPRQVEVSRLAMGTGTNGFAGNSNQVHKLGFVGMADLFKAAYDQGITFWDSADQYGSHPALREGLKSGIPREKVTIMTKTESMTARDMRADLDRFRKELGTDYIDILLLHYLHDDEWPHRADQRRVMPHSGRPETGGGIALGGGGPGTAESRRSGHGFRREYRSRGSAPDEEAGQGRHRHEDLWGG